jgi:hypothetical protein
MLMWLWTVCCNVLLEHWWARGREKADVSWPIARYSLATTGTSLSARPIGVTARGELAGRAGGRATAGAGRAVVMCRVLIDPFEFKFDCLNTNSTV